jgi:hypothetical protein
MFDIVVVKTCIDLFKDLLGLIDIRNKNKRDIFNNIVAPLRG